LIWWSVEKEREWKGAQPVGPLISLFPPSGPALPFFFLFPRVGRAPAQLPSALAPLPTSLSLSDRGVRPVSAGSPLSSSPSSVFPAPTNPENSGELSSPGPRARGTPRATKGRPKPSGALTPPPPRTLAPPASFPSAAGKLHAAAQFLTAGAPCPR
jgi:hypothetical protein